MTVLIACGLAAYGLLFLVAGVLLGHAASRGSRPRTTVTYTNLRPRAPIGIWNTETRAATYTRSVEEGRAQEADGDAA